MFKGFALGALTYVILNTGTALAQDSPRDNIPYEYTKRLEVNTENKTRKVTKLSELEGINDIRKLVETSEYEEAWIFSPKDSMWYEIGYNETGWLDDSLGVHNHVYLDSAFIDKMADSLDNVVCFHQHPIKGYPETKTTSYDNEFTAYLKDMMRRGFGEAVKYTTGALPSINDLNSMVFIHQLFLQRNPKAEINHQVVSYLGVSEHKLTDMAKWFITQENGSIIVATGYHTGMLYFLLGLKTISSFSTDSEKNIEEICIENINETVNVWSNDFIDMKFFPYRTLGIKE